MKGDYIGRNRLGSYFVSQNVEPPRASVVVGPGIHSLHILKQSNYLTTIPAAMLPLAEEMGVVKADIEANLWDSPAGLVYRASKEPLPIINSLLAILRTEIAQR
jgi:hypothetical protein